MTLLVACVFFPDKGGEVFVAAAMKVGYTFFNEVGCFRFVIDIGGFLNAYIKKLGDTFDDFRAFVASEYKDAFFRHLFREYSFLFHEVDKVFHQIAGAERMEHIVRRHNIPVEYPRCFKSMIHIALRDLQRGGKLADAIGYKLKGV